MEKEREKGEVIRRHAPRAIGREGGRDKIHGLAGGEEQVILPGWWSSASMNGRKKSKREHKREFFLNTVRRQR